MNNTLKRFSIFLLALFFSAFSFAQDSCHLRVSLLTCSPGSEIYSIFGHSAMRVVDRKAGTDIVYNYGTFDFNDPNFYYKFVKGKLLYYLSQENFADFQNEYLQDNRGIDEQVLNFSCAQQEELQQFLFHNMQEENRSYKYDFLFDNCTTRLRDIIEQKGDTAMKTGNITGKDGKTFRNVIHYYCNKGDVPWSQLGMDLLLGKKIDRKMTNREAMFLPEFLENAIDRTGKNNDSLVRKKEYPLVKPVQDVNDRVLFSPILVFSLLAFTIFALGFARNEIIHRFLSVFDIVFFLLIGLLGCLMTFMWFGTDHLVLSDNYNLFWAWPTHVIAAPLLIFLKKEFRPYFLAYSIVTLLLLTTWAILPQELNKAVIPVLALAGWRSWKIARGRV